MLNELYGIDKKHILHITKPFCDDMLHNVHFQASINPEGVIESTKTPVEDVKSVRVRFDDADKDTVTVSDFVAIACYEGKKKLLSNHSISNTKLHLNHYHASITF